LAKSAPVSDHRTHATRPDLYRTRPSAPAKRNDAEQRLWSILRAKRLGAFKFRRQHALGQYIADFICLSARLVIEVDGDTHDDARQVVDATRTEYIERIGYRVIRFWNSEVIQSPDEVAHLIADALGMISPAQVQSFPSGPSP